MRLVILFGLLMLAAAQADASRPTTTARVTPTASPDLRISGGLWLRESPSPENTQPFFGKPLRGPHGGLLATHADTPNAG